MSKPEVAYEVVFETGEYEDFQRETLFITPFEEQAKLYVDKANDYLIKHNFHSQCGPIASYTVRSEHQFPKWMLNGMVDYTGGEFHYYGISILFDTQSFIAENP